MQFSAYLPLVRLSEATKDIPQGRSILLRFVHLLTASIERSGRQPSPLSLPASSLPPSLPPQQCFLFLHFPQQSQPPARLLSSLFRSFPPSLLLHPNHALVHSPIYLLLQLFHCLLGGRSKTWGLISCSELGALRQLRVGCDSNWFINMN